VTCVSALNVRVRFFGSYRRLVDSPETVLTLENGATPLDLVYTLAERYGEQLRSALLAEREGFVRLRPGIRIGLGDELLDCGAELDHPLRGISAGRDWQIEVFIFPSLTGG
jgi:molybdopterin converting factor small subunit